MALCVRFLVGCRVSGRIMPRRDRACRHARGRQGRCAPLTRWPEAGPSLTAAARAGTGRAQVGTDVTGRDIAAVYDVSPSQFWFRLHLLMQPWPSPRTGVCKRQVASREPKSNAVFAGRETASVFLGGSRLPRRGEVTPKQGPRLRPEKGMREGASPEWAETGFRLAPGACA